MASVSGGVADMKSDRDGESGLTLVAETAPLTPDREAPVSDAMRVVAMWALRAAREAVPSANST